MKRVPLTHPITVGGEPVDYLDIAWPEKADFLGHISITDPVVRMIRLIMLLTGLPYAAAGQVHIDDWPAFEDAARSIA